MSYIAGKQEKLVTRGLVYAIDGIDHGTFPGNGSSSTTYGTLAGANNLTMQSTVTHRYHKNGILSFNGTSDYLSGSDSGFPSGASARTVGFWFRPLDFTDNWGAILTYGTTTAYQGFGITWNDTSHNILVGRYGGNSAANSTTIEMDRWHYMTVVFDGSSTIKFFLNASADGTATLSSINTQLSGNFTIGNGMSGWDSGYFKGQIGPLHIYNRELSTTEITQNYNLWKSRFQPSETSVITTNRVFHIDAGNTNSYGGSGTSITDLAGTQNATITSGAPFSSDDGGAFNLRGDSEDASITATNHADLRITGDITADIWVNFDATNIDNVNLIAHNASGESSQANYLYWMNWKTTSGGSIRYGHEYGSGTNKINTVAVTVETGRWYNFCIIRDHSGAIGTARTWYLLQDGVKIDSFTYTSGEDASGGSNSFTHIGSNIDGNDLNGKISSVRIYNTPLTLAQVKDNYNALAPRLITGHDAGETDDRVGMVTASLALDYDFGSPICNSGIGSTVTDLHDNNNGTISGATYSKENGGCLDFDGSNDKITLPSAVADFFSQQSFSVGLWIKLDNSTRADMDPFFSVYAASASNRYFKIQRNQNDHGNNESEKLQMNFYGDDLNNTGAVFTSTDWTYFVGTFDNSTKLQSIYTNGTLYDSRTATSNTNVSGGSVHIGADDAALGSRFLDGKVAMCHIYDNKALTAAEVLQNYNATKSRFGL